MESIGLIPNRAEVRTANFQSAISAPVLSIEPQDLDQSIHRDPVNGLIMILRICGKIRADRVNRPSSHGPEQGRNPISRHSSAIFAPTLPTALEDHDQTIHRVPVNGLIVILRFYGFPFQRGALNQALSAFAPFCNHCIMHSLLTV